MQTPHATLSELVAQYSDRVKDGYINPALPWFSPKDLERRVGHTRQYWCKLIRQGKLQAKETSAGPIVTTEQLIEFYNKERKE